MPVCTICQRAVLHPSQIPATVLREPGMLFEVPLISGRTIAEAFVVGTDGSPTQPLTLHVCDPSKLFYLGHTEMDPQSVSSDGRLRHPLWHTLSFIKAGIPVRVRLEPGDCTRYEFVVVRLQDIAGEIPGWESRDNPMLVTTLVGGSPREAFVVHDCSRAEDFGLKNDWTAILLAWWFRCLYVEMETGLSVAQKHV